MILLCVTKDSSDYMTKIRYDAVNEIPFLKDLGIYPTRSGEMMIKCPFQGKALTNFTSAFGDKFGDKIKHKI